ncbi:MAG: phage head closure protein [Candidatus Omnitrophica bacterium]|nr:phage head closure protein [Candidatus Omnitrophota bacterium]
MFAGRLNKRITIQQLVADAPPANTLGEPQNTWTAVQTVWAAVEPLQGREFWAQQQIQAEITIRVRIRYLSGVTSGMRVLYGDRILDIDSVIDPKEKHVEMQLMCSEGVTNG